MPQAEVSVRGRVYVVRARNTFTTAKVLIEIDVPTANYAEILRCWAGPAEGTDPIDEILPIALYTNNTTATGLTAMNERLVQGGGDGASNLSAGRDGTVGTTPDDIYRDAFHLSRGWVYLPVPDERIKIAGHSSGSINFFGMRLPVTPVVSTTLAFGITWREFT